MTSLRIAASLLVGAALCCAGPIHAAPFSSLVVGQPWTAETIEIGRYSLKLPPGAWTTAVKAEYQAGMQSGSSGAPTQLSAIFTRVEEGQIRAILWIRTPANSFVGVNRWNDDPCKSFENPVVTDTMKQTFAMPECFAVARAPAQFITDMKSGVGGQFAQWIASSQLKVPENLWRVYYSKYWRGDFLHLNVFIPATGDHSAAETWGRKMAAAIRPMVLNDASQAVLPSLP